MSKMFRFGKQPTEALDRALTDWRNAEKSPERLSGPARERILDAATRGGGRQVRFSLPSPLFLPARRFALAAVLPLLVLSLSVAYLVLPGGTVPGADDTAPRLLTSRLGDQVIFVIANGDRPHRVLKTDDPRVPGSGEPLDVEQGVFRDRLDSGADLVFYRID